MRIFSNPKGTDVELVILGNILQEVFGVRPEAGMVPWATSRKLEVVHILKIHNHYHTIPPYNEKKNKSFYDIILLSEHNKQIFIQQATSVIQLSIIQHFTTTTFQNTYLFYNSTHNPYHFFFFSNSAPDINFQTLCQTSACKTTRASGS